MAYPDDNTGTMYPGAVSDSTDLPQRTTGQVVEASHMNLVQQEVVQIEKALGIGYSTSVEAILRGREWDNGTETYLDYRTTGGLAKRLSDVDLAIANYRSHRTANSDVHGIGSGSSVVGTNTTQNLLNKTINKVTITEPSTSATLTLNNASSLVVAASKTFTVSNSLTFTGTDTSTTPSVNFGSGGTVLYTTSSLDPTNISGTVPVNKGGTNLSTTPTNGQLLIGNGTNYSLATLTQGTGMTITNGAGSISIANAGVLSITGTSNRITASGSTGAITLSTPQDIATTSSPTFNSVSLSSTIPSFTATGTSDTNSSSGTVDFKRSSGSSGGITQSGDRLGVIRFYGWTGSANVQGAQINAYADATHTASSSASYVNILTAAPGSTSPAERFRVDSTGVTLDTPLSVSNGGTGVSSLSTNRIILSGTSGTGDLRALSSGSSGQVLSSNGSGSDPSWITSTSSNTASAIVQRDSSGEISVGGINLNSSTNIVSVFNNTYVSSSTKSTTWGIQGYSGIQVGLGVVGGVSTATLYGGSVSISAGSSNLDLSASNAINLTGSAINFVSNQVYIEEPSFTKEWTKLESFIGSAYSASTAKFRTLGYSTYTKVEFSGYLERSAAIAEGTETSIMKDSSTYLPTAAQPDTLTRFLVATGTNANPTAVFIINSTGVLEVFIPTGSDVTKLYLDGISYYQNNN